MELNELLAVVHFIFWLMRLPFRRLGSPHTWGGCVARRRAYRDYRLTSPAQSQLHLLKNELH
jgi:hypothetical protein